MLILALDTTTRVGSMALLRDDAVLVERVGDALRPHAERLPAELVVLLADHAVTLADVDVFAVGAGPGSFTGLRIGIASMQGLALVTARPLLAVSALDALVSVAAGAEPAPPWTAGWMDAHRHEVFSVLAKGRPADGVSRWLPGEADPASVGSPESVIERWRTVVGEAGRLRIAGDGAILYRDLLAAGFGSRVEVLAPVPPLAAMIARLARERVLAGERPAPGAVTPVYVRRPDAELAREKAQRSRT